MVAGFEKDTNNERIFSVTIKLVFMIIALMILVISSLKPNWYLFIKQTISNTQTSIKMEIIYTIKVLNLVLF